jgi:NADPH2:quinone reductase
MRAIGVFNYGGPEVLEQLHLPEPQAGPGQVRIRVHAATVNPVDILIRNGGAAGAFTSSTPPIIPGLDVAGVLDELGAGTTTALSVGDRVMALVNPTRPAGGGYAEYVVLPAAFVVAAPAGWTHAEAATLPLNGLTARRALADLGLSPRQTLAVTGAAGAVGGFVVQLAKADGLTVVADAADADLELVRSLGADLILPRGGDLGPRIAAAVPGGVDGVVDAACLGASLLAAVRDGGGLALVRAPVNPELLAVQALQRGIRVRQANVHEYDGDQAELDRLRRLAEQGALTARVAEVLPVAQAAEAHRRLDQGGVRGRLVLRF